MTRAEHLQWCKDRALAYVEAGDLENAFQSLASDLTKHPDLAGAVLLNTQLGTELLIAGHLNSPEEMTKWINGFR